MKEKAQKGTLKKVLRYIQKYRLFVALSLVLAAVTVAGTLYIPILTGRAVDLIVSPGQVDFPGIFRLLLQAGIVIGIAAFAQWVMNLCNNHVTYRVVRDIRSEAFCKLQSLPLSYLDAHPTGEVVSRVIADVDQFADGLLMGFTQLFSGIITILGTLLFMLSVNVAITLVVVLITPVSLLVAAFIAKRTYTMFHQQSLVRGEQTGFIEEMIEGQRVVQAFGQEEKAQKRFDEINARLQGCSLRAIFFSSITNPSTRFVNSLVYTGVGVAGALSVIGGGLTVGMLSCFLSYANQYTKPFNEISGVVTELQNALACAGRVFALIEEKPQQPDPVNARTLVDPDGRVQAENVSFSYRRGQPLIENFSLQVKPGQRVALVGPTGCGKTTIINLLMRFYDVDSGAISVDGEDIRLLTRKSLRKNYGMVLQETWLKRGTIAENISYGKPDAAREEIVEAAKAAHAHSFIKRLPKGYDTTIGEGAENLSQGQKQLLCIARVMLSLPPMLILDEATSSIDTRTESRIQRAFQKMMQGRTSFIVAHRLSTIRDADVILVMRDGHIVEQGSHQELLQKGGFYAELYNSQFAKT
ncbi:ABC transporter ATP-binding protein [Neglecta sp. X4]|uniref:ABC transporter ATP-binding protein n=1 Tax=unclassified Neglectibacter TaxID=2632164 RepID=UPI00136C7CB1|nr:MULTISPECIES: ABC transporter ATP-binding protein [unclassified Neglectibacter]NBI18193.1 ABC transporter ATP-binding protein [Neglectibacter sp. 59]NBJ73870.1 ABC transporter ATP-binding protein [Neglectibacter sp. X4]NCE80598.1 ABC transporter ATP-binding protein [Neglectibacter sp. X58]